MPLENCIFCRIAAGALPAAIVHETPGSIAFLDTRPLFAGHCLLIPREHYETLTDLPVSAVPELFTTARELAGAVESALGAQGSFVAINNRISQSVPHLHIHIVPRRPKDGLKGFFWPRGKYRDETEQEAARTAIAGAMARTL